MIELKPYLNKRLSIQLPTLKRDQLLEKEDQVASAYKILQTTLKLQTNTKCKNNLQTK
jgi:hypothetical protein